jgi:hypothetical protein
MIWIKPIEFSGLGCELFSLSDSGPVGAEGFEALFPSGHYAVFLVGFNSKTSLRQGLARIL